MYTNAETGGGSSIRAALRGFGYFGRLRRSSFAAAGCALDPAEREYLEALKGEETGMSAHADRLYRSRDCTRAGSTTLLGDTRDLSRRSSRISAAIADFDGAMEHLVQLEPQVSTSYYVRGKARPALGHYDEAIADFTDA